MTRSSLRGPFEAGALVALTAIAACQRAPAELAPPVTEAPRSVEKAEARPVERCLDPLPEVPPRPAAAAPSGACPRDDEGPLMLRKVAVRVEGGERPIQVDAELAESPRAIERGLMFRTELGESSGMLFRLRERTIHTFWMHNTCIPLDMLFLDDDGTVVGVVEQAAPLTDDIRQVRCASSWVLETQAGWTRRHGVRPGHRVVLPP